VPEDMSEYHLRSKERVFSVCGQIVASLILSVSNVQLYRQPWAGEAKADLAASVSEAGRTWITELGKTSIFVQ